MCALSAPPPPVAVVRFSGDPLAPITMLFIDATIEVMLSPKASVPRDADQIAADIWAVAGVYVLLGLPEGEGIVRARPGSGHDVLARLRQHPRENPWSHGRSSPATPDWAGTSPRPATSKGADTIFAARAKAFDHDSRRDQDHTLQKHEEDLIEQRYLPPIVAALQLTGVPIDPITT